MDWSGRVDAAGQRRHIWAGIWSEFADGRTTVTLEAGRTREEIAEWLLAMGRQTPQLVVSIDCCFSYPAWFLREHGCKSVVELWEKVTAGLGERWLARHGEGGEVIRDARFWGKPHPRPAEFSGEGYRRMFRFTDFDNKIAQALRGGDMARAAKMRGITPKSPFQIGGSGSVGTGSLRAMPMLLRLYGAGFRIWPFQTAELKCESPSPLVVEMYTRLMTGPVAKSNPEARRRYLAAKTAEDELYGGIDRTVLTRARGSEDAFDALVSTMEMVRHADSFAELKATEDPDLRLEGVTWRPDLD